MTTRAQRRKFDNDEFANNSINVLSGFATTDTPYFESFDEVEKDTPRSLSTRPIPRDSRIRALRLIPRDSNSWCTRPIIIPRGPTKSGLREHRISTSCRHPSGRPTKRQHPHDSTLEHKDDQLKAASLRFKNFGIGNKDFDKLLASKEGRPTQSQHPQV